MRILSNCLTFKEIYNYATETKVNNDTMMEMSRISCHLLNCKSCANKVFLASCAIEAIGDWSFLAEKKEQESSEILDVLINLEKAKDVSKPDMVERITAWMKRITASSIKLSVNIKEMCEIVIEETMGMLNGGKYKFGYATPAHAGAFRDNVSQKDKTYVIDENNSFNSVKILENGSIEVQLSIVGKDVAPIVLLMPIKSEKQPIVKIMECNKDEKCWITTFENVTEGEYSLLIE